MCCVTVLREIYVYNAGTISRETYDKMCEALESAREDRREDSFLRHFE